MMSRMDEESMVATLPWLRQRLLDELGLQEVRVGRHVRRDHPERAVLDLVGIWIAEVRPAFDPAAVCAVIEGPQLHRFGLVVETRRTAPLGDVQGAAVATADVPAEWQDTLVDALQNARLYQPSDVVTLDGISYRVDADTRDIRCSLDFANPRSEGTMRLERGLLAAVEGLERATSIPLLGEYLDTWRTYISRA